MKFYVTYRYGSNQKDCYSVVEADTYDLAEQKVRAKVGIEGYSFIHNHQPLYSRNLIDLQQQTFGTVPEAKSKGKK